jgi:hypothetical protein
MDEKLTRILIEKPADLPALLRGERAADAPSVMGSIWTLTERAPSKDLKKAAKKALYLLKSAGFDVDAHRPRHAADIADRPSEEVLTCYLSVPDSYGHNRLILPVGREDGSSMTVYSVICHLEKGVLSLSSERGNRKVLGRLVESEPVSPVRPDYALFRLNRTPSRTEGAPGAVSLPDVLRRPPAGEIEHPVLSRIPSTLSRIVSPDATREIFQRGDIARLSIPEEHAAGFREQVAEARRSRLIVSNLTPEERAKVAVERFARTYFSPERLSLYATMLFDIALYDAVRGRQEEARIIVDLAQSFRAAGTRIMTHPFTQLLLYRAFGGE